MKQAIVKSLSVVESPSNKEEILLIINRFSSDASPVIISNNGMRAKIPMLSDTADKIEQIIREKKKKVPFFVSLNIEIR